MTENRIALGIVGASASYGWGMRAHLPAFLALPEYDLAAVCTTRQETAEESAKAYGARKCYWDFRDMVADPEIEVVDVCVRAPAHYEVAMAALEAGKHVFCEWPLGANSAQADEMASLAEAKGVRTMVGLQSRYAPSFQRFRQLVQEGYLGRLISANMTMFPPRPWPSSPGRCCLEHTERGRRSHPEHRYRPRTGRLPVVSGRAERSIGGGHDSDAPVAGSRHRSLRRCHFT